VNEVLDRVRGGLVVSCQAYPGEPMRHPDTMARVAQACVDGGAVGIRAQGLEDIAAVRARVTVPVIGLWKDGDADVFITPTLGHARAVRDAGADVVALDGTRRPRPDGLTLSETVSRLRASGDVLVMADCGSVDDALAAREAGVDLVGTTLAGYTGERPHDDGPDLDLVERLCAVLAGVPVVAEGRYATPAQVRAALDLGAHAVVVGTAITHPTTLTAGFVAATR
jgi:N-acylglucosamine-6-phosphate 2-epimerase